MTPDKKMIKKKVLLYVNPDFDKRFNHGISKLYRIFCKDLNCDIHIINTLFLKENIPDQEYSEILIIAGGDGTIHKVLNTIPEEAFNKYIFGIIPGGTANEFANGFKIPNSFYKAAELIVNSTKIYYQHLGILNNKYKFATGLLYGIEGLILKETTKMSKHMFGNTAFYFGVLKFILDSYKPIKVKPLTFRINSRKFRTNYLLINNASLKGKKIKDHEIKGEDPSLFSLVYLHSRLKLYEFLRIMFKNHMRYKVLEDPAVYYEQIFSAFLEFPGKQEFFLDGESYHLISPLEIKHYKTPIAIIAG